MTYEECIIVSAYTGYLMCNFDDLQAFVQEKLKRPVWTHELAEEKTWEEIREAVKPDFMGLCKPRELSKAKLAEAKIQRRQRAIEMLKMKEDGHRVKDIAEKYGITPAHASQIITYEFHRQVREGTRVR